MTNRVVLEETGRNETINDAYVLIVVQPSSVSSDDESNTNTRSTARKVEHTETSSVIAVMAVVVVPPVGVEPEAVSVRLIDVVEKLPVDVLDPVNEMTPLEGAEVVAPVLVTPVNLADVGVTILPPTELVVVAVVVVVVWNGHPTLTASSAAYVPFINCETDASRT